MVQQLTRLEIGLLFLAAVFFQFTAVNVNPTLGNLYTAFAVLAGLFILLDPHRSINLKKGNNSSLGALVKGAGAYVVLVLVSSYIIVPGVQKIVALLSSTTPVLAQSASLNKVIFGLGVPYVETLFFFAVALDFLASIFNIDIMRNGLYKMKTWILIMSISFVFMVYHLTAKGINAFDTLAVVFAMAIISLVLVIWDESYESALYFHIVSNVSALLFV